MGGEQGVSVGDSLPTSYGGRAQWASAECRVQLGAFLTRDSDPRRWWCLLLLFKQKFTARELLDHQGCRTGTIKHLYHIRLHTYNTIFHAHFSVWLLFPKRTELFNRAFKSQRYDLRVIYVIKEKCGKGKYIICTMYGSDRSLSELHRGCVTAPLPAA